MFKKSCKKKKKNLGNLFFSKITDCNYEVLEFRRVVVCRSCGQGCPWSSAADDTSASFSNVSQKREKYRNPSNDLPTSGRSDGFWTRFGVFPIPQGPKIMLMLMFAKQPWVLLSALINPVWIVVPVCPSKGLQTVRHLLIPGLKTSADYSTSAPSLWIS